MKQHVIVCFQKRYFRQYILWLVEIDLLQTIPGVGKDSAINIISEVGVDMSRFPDETHLSSWAGMSPGNCETGGKKKV